MVKLLKKKSARIECKTRIAPYSQNVQIPDYIPPFTSCYETLYQQEELIERARAMEDSARQIRQQFQTIADSGFPLPTSTLLRKAVVSVKKGKFMFSTEQLSCVVQMIMENKPSLLFRPKSDTKDYVILVFWSTNFDDTLCSIQENAEVIKQEVLADGYQLRFKVENIPSPQRFRVRLDWTRSNAKRRLATFASGRLRHSRRLPTFARNC